MDSEDNIKKACRYWKPHEGKGCRDGDSCAFAHAKPSTYPCKYFAKGHCKDGSRCRYAHGTTSESTGADSTRSSPPTSAATTPSSSSTGALRSKPPPLATEHKESRLDPAFVAHQERLGAQSMRGICGRPDFSALNGDRHGLRVFRQMLAREKAMAGEWTVFYHSYNSPALIYEVQAAVAKVLFRFGAKHGVLPRLLKKPFEKLPDADAILKAFPTWKDQDHNPEFKSVGICVSTSLLSQDPEATPTDVFLTGYGASQVDIAVLRRFLRNCGTPGEHVSRLAEAISKLAYECGLPQATGAAMQGHMLQIFIHRSCVDKWAYASHPFGVPDESRTPLSKSMAGEGVVVGQARLNVNPSAFMRARSVRLYAYSADEGFHRKRQGFQQALFDALNPILGEPEVREEAARGIYGGQLPSWWKDQLTEQVEAPGDDVTDVAGAASGTASEALPAAGDWGPPPMALEEGTAMDWESSS